ncbi:unnamed protein product [Rhodiola kirilowii]
MDDVCTASAQRPLCRVVCRLLILSPTRRPPLPRKSERILQSFNGSLMPGTELQGCEGCQLSLTQILDGPKDIDSSSLLMKMNETVLSRR